MITIWFVEKERIYDFLVGLNLDFDAVRVQVLGMEDLHSLNETIAIVCRDFFYKQFSSCNYEESWFGQAT